MTITNHQPSHKSTKRNTNTLQSNSDLQIDSGMKLNIFLRPKFIPNASIFIIINEDTFNSRHHRKRISSSLCRSYVICHRLAASASPMLESACEVSCTVGITCFCEKASGRQVLITQLIWCISVIRYKCLANFRIYYFAT